MSDNPTFTVTTTTEHTYREGWGVSVLTIHAGDDEPDPDAVVDIDVSVVPIRESVAQDIGGFWCVPVDNYWIEIDNFADVPDLTADDTHDLRTRWFATREEAESHAAFVTSTWGSPAPWVSFVQT